MILLKLTDGMGNQMFQYAYARYLQSIYGGNIYFDLTKLGGKHVRSYDLNHFRLNSNVVIPSRFMQYASRFYTKIVRLFLIDYLVFRFILKKVFIHILST